LILSPQNIAEILQAEPKFSFNSSIDSVAIDSRSLQIGSGTLFFALVGVNHDGHAFIPDLIASGVVNFVVETIPPNLLHQANFYIVNDTLAAFQKFAAVHRKKFNLPVIGITGSNGKTIVKEWLNYLLSPEYNIVRSPKSYNSQVGVPLSVLGINNFHNLGIFEAGISTTSEMHQLEEMIKPNIGILTNIRSVHDEGFNNRDEKIIEKLHLFRNCEVLICEKIEAVVSKVVFPTKLFCWSFSDKTASVVVSSHVDNDKTFITFRHADTEFAIEIPFTDSASVENAISCVMLMLYLNYNPDQIRIRTADLFPVSMRLVVKNGINNTTLIDDSYNSDVQSLKIALDFLESQEHHNKKKTVILSDISQGGIPAELLYTNVAELLALNNVYRIIAIGPHISKVPFKNVKAEYYQTTEQFFNEITSSSFANEIILIKGARAFEFEKIVSMLEEKTHETVLEINLTALTHNLTYYRSKILPTTKLMVMIKAYGYGFGGLEIARLLQFNNVDYLGVAFADEGIILRSAGIKLPIMVLNPENTSFSAIIDNQLEPEIYSINGLNSFIQIASEKGITNYPIHIKIDTGMHRLGLEEAQMPELIKTLRHSDVVVVKSILSHMATSDDAAHAEFALSQISSFERTSSMLMAELKINPDRHLLNSSGISNFPQAQYDMVRLGIGFYGISNDPAEQKYLETVGTLKSVISQIRTISEGDSVGYGRRFVAEKETKIATIPIGYADGISRSWGNGVGYVRIKNRKAPIIGSVCMDMLMVDCSNINCSEGDFVIIFGESPTVMEMAEKLNTISYEIITGISQRVKRNFYRE
jgi:alanine racemase